MSVDLLVDNDVVIKLSRMDVFSEGMQVIGAEEGKVGSLRVMLRYMGIADEKRRLRLTQDNKAEAERLNVALHSIVELELTAAESKDAASLMKMALDNELDVDGGELMLMVVALHRGGIDIATGDKRAIRSLPALAELWPPVGSLRDRIVCLEQIFARLSTLRGIARVRTAVSTSPKADSTISYILDQTSSGGPTRFVAGVKLVLDHQIEEPAPGWLKKF